MYLDLKCFLYASTVLSISFFIVISLNFFVALIHFSEALFSFAYFISCLIISKKCLKSISFGIIDNLFLRLAKFYYLLPFYFYSF